MGHVILKLGLAYAKTNLTHPSQKKQARKPIFY